MNPVEDFIPREIENRELEKLLAEFSDGLDSVVDFGSNIFKWDLDKNRSGDENIPITLSLRHFIELIDAMSILIRKASVDPATLLLRGSLEVYFGLEYLFEADTHRRSMAFMVCYFHKKLKFFEKFDSNKTQSQQFKASIRNDRLQPDFSTFQNTKFEIEKNNWESLLQYPIYQSTEVEYQRLINARETNPSWYRLFNGPRNISELAKHLKLTVFYEILYRQWSGPTHGIDIFEGKIFGNADGSSDIVQIRYPKDAQSVASWAIALSLNVFKLYIEKRIPERLEEFNKWYITIRDLYLRLSRGDQLIKVE